MCGGGEPLALLVEQDAVHQPSALYFCNLDINTLHGSVQASPGVVQGDADLPDANVAIVFNQSDWLHIASGLNVEVLHLVLNIGSEEGTDGNAALVCGKRAHI